VSVWEFVVVVVVLMICLLYLRHGKTFRLSVWVRSFFSLSRLEGRVVNGFGWEPEFLNAIDDRYIRCHGSTVMIYTLGLA
jgi:hypothetical protein